MAASMSLSYLSMRFTQLVVMIAGTYFVLHGELSEGGFISFLLLVGVFFRPVEKINAVLETYPKGSPGSGATPNCWTPSRISSTPPARSRFRDCAATSATRT